ncbi:chromosomal replication initiation protein [bacterium BMS3Abin07]|nr:chromosomal replication initiation protein [bacterium BMS3Abin07]
MEEIIELAAKQYGITPEEILDDRNREARKAAVYLTKKHTEVTNLEIGEQMGGVSYSAVLEVVERMEKEMGENRNMKKGINRMEGNLPQVKDDPMAFYVPTISLSPSTTSINSSGFATPIFFPIRSTDKVLIWLIFTHERLGSLLLFNSRVNGNPAR